MNRVLIQLSGLILLAVLSGCKSSSSPQVSRQAILSALTQVPAEKPVTPPAIVEVKRPKVTTVKAPSETMIYGNTFGKSSVLIPHLTQG